MTAVSVAMNEIKVAQFTKEDNAQSGLHGCSVIGITFKGDLPTKWALFTVIEGAKLGDTVTEGPAQISKIRTILDKAIATHGGLVDIHYVYAEQNTGTAEMHAAGNTMVRAFLQPYATTYGITLKQKKYKNKSNGLPVTVLYFPGYVATTEGPVSVI
ncbi:hypothetical protein B0T26DRAFT_802665 [Lasiosphaeria miniovina]|uniref:Uncharacterized protein n=1 Tax=Lasiosphaeria miniovina TaxID=1954250 RepID=A0AA40AKR1_9PEZI|nr:uncharacterized protein B0T26DRAFT_802665 [Lasiosphaeria miniovina]KAK0717570.1 hypothetical protein B0T26DRAFT_802665 [Lasiosphaeria miniovina]